MKTPQHFHYSVDADRIAWLTFDQADSSANLLSEVTLRELDDLLDLVILDPSLKALVIRSAKTGIFVAGADLKAVQSLPSDRLDALIYLGQAVFTRLAALPIKKIAAIQGACVGGGLELALACDWRIGADHATTKLGLPETQLGLIPAWGGSTKLPRLIGLPAALEMILSGRILNPRSAQKIGLLDETVAPEHMETAARSAALRPKTQRQQSIFNYWPLSEYIAHRAKKNLLKRTRGLHAAPELALNVVTRGLRCEEEESLANEHEAMASLAHTPATQQLVRLFFRKEAANKRKLGNQAPEPVRRVAVVGAGVMGAGIAHHLATHWIQVLLCDISPEAISSGLQRIRSLAGAAVKRHIISAKQGREIMDRIHTAHTPVPLHGYQLIIEAASEDMAVKKKIFASVAERSAPSTILATNTSALSVTELATAVPKPERVIGLHFFNPVHRMPLVEIIRTPYTSVTALATATSMVQRIAKTPIICDDSPGFIVNRILTPYLMEAVRLHEQGHGVLEIDESMLDFGMPMGPLRLLDEIGLDIAVHVAKTLQLDATPLAEMVTKGQLGAKSGRGFYDHRTGRPVPNPHRGTCMHRMDGLGDHLATILSAEAIKVMNENVVSDPADIDLAMVLGAGYPPFRGGPLLHAGVTSHPARLKLNARPLVEV